MSSSEIKQGDRVKTINGRVETVVNVIFPMVYIDKAHANTPGGGYHHTKVFKVSQKPLRPAFTQVRLSEFQPRSNPRSQPRGWLSVGTPQHAQHVVANLERKTTASKE